MRAAVFCLAVALSMCPLSLIQPNPGVHQSHAPQACLPTAAQMIGLAAASFTENAGQLDDADTGFCTQFGNAAFSNGSMALMLPGADGASVEKIVFSFVGANRASPEGLEYATWHTSFFRGSDPARWVCGARNYRSIIYENLWDGIDMVYKAEAGGLKYELRLDPGASHEAIRIRVSGHQGMSLGASDTLRIAGLTSDCAVTDSGLDVFYAADPNKKLDASFALVAPDTYSFIINNRDMSKPVVIDPLIYSTYLGGPGDDMALAVAIGQSGCAYITGTTDSIAFMDQQGGEEPEPRESTDLFVAKLSDAGTGLEYCAFIGGSEHDSGAGIAVNATGCAVVTGATFSADFPTTAQAYDRSYNGVGDAFVAKLGPEGDKIVFSTYLGGRHDDAGAAIALDESGSAYVTGRTWSASFPTTQGSFNASINGDSDAFVTKLNQFGDMLEYSTFLGGAGSEFGSAISVLNGSAYVVGVTQSSAFAPTPMIIGNPAVGTENAFVARVGKRGSALEALSIIGGAGLDIASGIAVDAIGQVYVTGETNSTDFPVTPKAYDCAHNGGTDAFVLKLNMSSSSAIYSTYIGGSADDASIGVGVDSEGCAFIAGRSTSSNFPVTTGAVNSTYFGRGDAFIAKLSTSGRSLLYSSFLAGKGMDEARALVVSEAGCAYVAGATSSSDFPSTNHTFSVSNNGGTDAFVSALDITPPSADAGPDIRVNESAEVTLNGSASFDNAAITDYKWSFHDGIAYRNLSGQSPTHMFEVPGTYTVFLRVADSVNNSDVDRMILTVLEYPIPIARAGPDRAANEFEAVNFNGSASRDNVGIRAYMWTFNDGHNIVAMDGPMPQWTFTAPGTYEITLTVLDADGNWDSDTLNVTVSDTTSPLVLPMANMTADMGAPVTLDAHASLDNAGIVNYTWSFTHNGTHVVLYGETPTFTFWAEGTYSVTLVATDAAGNSASNAIAICIHGAEPQPPAETTFTVGAILFIASLILFLAVAFSTGRGKKPAAGKAQNGGDEE